MNRILRSYLFQCVAVGGLVLAGVVVFYSCRFGSLSLAVAYLAGERFVVLPYEVDLGECEDGTRCVATFTAVNLTSKPIRVVGSQESCNCLNLEDLPIVVEAGEKREISVRARVFGTGVYTQDMQLLIDDQGLQFVPMRISARVRPVPPKST